MGHCMHPSLVRHHSELSLASSVLRHANSRGTRREGATTARRFAMVQPLLEDLDNIFSTTTRARDHMIPIINAAILLFFQHTVVFLGTDTIEGGW